MSFFFLRSDVADEVCVGDFSVLGDCMLSNGEDCSRALYFFVVWPVFAYSIREKSTEFVCASSCPSLFVGTFEQFL